MSLNLHDIVRPAITANLADQTFTLYRSTGFTFSAGIKTASYEAITGVSGQFQSAGDAQLDHAELAGQNTIIRELYVYASTDRTTRPWSIYRPLARSGDYFLDALGGYWLVTAVVEDFSDAGWEHLRVTFQDGNSVPDFSTEESES